MVFITHCDSPAFWQTYLSDPESITMEGILIFNKHLLVLLTVIVFFVFGLWFLFQVLKYSEIYSSSIWKFLMISDRLPRARFRSLSRYNTHRPSTDNDPCITFYYEDASFRQHGARPDTLRAGYQFGDQHTNTRMTIPYAAMQFFVPPMGIGQQISVPQHLFNRTRCQCLCPNPNCPTTLADSLYVVRFINVQHLQNIDIPLELSVFPENN